MSEPNLIPVHPNSYTCEGCDLCCVLAQVDELDKKGGVPCEHLCEKGCSIHPEVLGKETRPKPCWKFQCMWMQGFLKKNESPEKLGFYLALGDFNKKEIRVFSKSRAALSSLKARTIIKRFIDINCIVVLKVPTEDWSTVKAPKGYKVHKEGEEHVLVWEGKKKRDKCKKKRKKK